MLALLKSRRNPANEIDPVVEAMARERLNQRLQSYSASGKASSRSAVYGALRGHDRGADRAVIYRVATALFSPETAVNCRVVNQSYSGLRLEFDAEVDCPDEFGVTIPTLRFVGVVRKVWSNGRSVGVSIIRWTEAD